MKIRRIKIIDEKTKKAEYREVTPEQHNKLLEDIGRANLNIEVKLINEREL